jgi:probable HAF family extracellular repeat protein
MRRISILLLVFFTCLALAAWPQAQTQPKYQQYRVYDLGTLGGPDSSTSYFVISLTNKGVIGGGQTTTPDPFNPNCLGNLFFPPDCYVMHAFQWNRGILADLRALPGNNGNNSSFASAINNDGLISGFSETGSIDPDTGYPETHAVLWNKGKIRDLGTFGGTQSAAMDVNDLGQVVGGALNTTDDPFEAEFVFGFGLLGWTGTTQVRAFVWQNGVMRDLGTLGGPDAFAYAINRFGQIAGQSYTSDTPNPTTGIPTVDPFLWTNGKMIDLGTLGGTIGFPVWLNDWGQVVGFSNLAGDQFYHGFLWEHGAFKDLPPASGGDNSWALWINDLGDVIGGSNLPGDQLYHASLWRHRKPIDLLTLGQDTCSEAWNTNDLGQIVGISYSCSSEQTGRAFLWQNGGPMVDLNALVENPSSLHLYAGAYINDLGEIVAQGVFPNGDFHAALLVPDGDCKEDCEQRILASQNAPVVRANAGSTSPAFGKEAKSLHNRLGQRYALPGQH